MQRSLALLILLALPFHLRAQWHSVGDVDSWDTSRANEITLHAGGTSLRLTALTDDLIRIHFSRGDTIPSVRSWAVVPQTWPHLQTQRDDAPSALTLTTAGLRVVVAKRPLRITIFDRNGVQVNADDPSNGISWNPSEVRVWKTMPAGERYYGFGEKAGSLERRGKAMTMWNSDIPAYGADTDPLYESIPFFYGINQGRTYGIFLDNPSWSSFDMGKQNRDKYSFGAESGDLDYYVLYGPSPRKILTRFTELVGRMPLPPRWSLGYQQCRWSYSPDSRLRTVARAFREKKIPCDVLYLDIDYMDGYRIFTWSPGNFPQPERLLSDLAAEGFKVVTIIDPGIKIDSSYEAYRSGLAAGAFVRLPDGKQFRGKVWPGECVFPDFADSTARRWWGEHLSSLVSAGVRGFWNDMNEPSVFDVPSKTIDLDARHNADGRILTHAEFHNVYGMEMTRATREGVRRLLPDERPFLLTRASFAGGHRFSAVWTGDNIATWEHLRMALTMCLNLSISGQPFVGSDIGGFIGYPTGELFARWLELGVFTPLMRAHSVINERNKEPWEYGPGFTEINRRTIELRYRFLPHIYNVMVQASRTGLPAMRPLAFEYPAEESLAHIGDEFLFGDDLLVAPVFSEGAISREVELPHGVWYNYWTGVREPGGRRVVVDAPVDRIPLFVKAGGVIFTQQLVQYSDQAPIDPLTLSIYPADSPAVSQRTYYEDDGHSLKYLEHQFMERTITTLSSGGRLNIALSRRSGAYRPGRRFIVIRTPARKNDPSGVNLNGKALPRLPNGQGSDVGWSIDPGRAVVVQIPERDAAETLSISYP